MLGQQFCWFLGPVGVRHSSFGVLFIVTVYCIYIIIHYSATSSFCVYNQESKRSFLHSVVNEGGDKEKLESFVNFCEDTIFEVSFINLCEDSIF